MIRATVISLLTLVVLVPSTHAGSKKEDEPVNRAIQSIEDCLHWGGEVGDQSEERMQQIIEGANRDCPKAQEDARKAYSAYPDNIALSPQLIRFVYEHYFEVSESQMKKLCENASIYFKKVYEEQDPVGYFYYKDNCLKKK